MGGNGRTSHREKQKRENDHCEGQNRCVVIDVTIDSCDSNNDP